MSAKTPAQKATVDSLSVRGIGAPGDSVLFDGTADNVYLPFPHRPRHHAL